MGDGGHSAERFRLFHHQRAGEKTNAFLGEDGRQKRPWPTPAELSQNIDPVARRAPGAAFIIFDNFHVIEKYNTADAYVIGVGHLSDRIRGGAAIKSRWPRSDRALSFNEKKEMQRRLLAKGFDPDGLDGIVGPNTIAAVQAYQKSVGMVPDGYTSLKILKSLR